MNSHSSPHAPKPLGPYSQAISAGGIVYVSGQLGVDAETLKLVDETSIAAQTNKALENIATILNHAQSSMSQVIKLQCMLAVEGAEVVEFNKVYESFLTKARTIKHEHNDKATILPLPARSTMIVKALPMGAKVMIDAIAIQNDIIQ
jgi:2-iminobutanoate/2-iminopropanoate deaminase